MSARITFYGGAGEVTGANFLLDIGSAKILVDCGEREGLDARNSIHEPFAYDVKGIQALLVTHAHQDHIGRIPQLVRAGFRGVIYSTPATKDLAEIMFEDALGIVEREAAYTHTEPPYDKDDIAKAISLWQTCEYHESFSIGDVGVEMFDAGHILGSAMMKITRGSRSILFTGDIGNSPEPLLNDTETPEGATYLVMESVYGDRKHDAREERKKMLREAIEDARARNATLLIPSFSIERTQVLLSEMNDLVEREHMAQIPVYLDAPLATRVTEIFRKYPNLLNPAVRERVSHGDDPFSFPGLKVVDTTAGSVELDALPDPKVILAGAGMSVGGRVRRHEQALLSKKTTTVLFVGYQSPGSLGRRLQDGAQKVEIDGVWVRVHAQISTLSGYSGHADRNQLVDFLEKTAPSLERAFITMGEPKSSLFLAQRAKDFLGVNAYVPQKGESVEIEL